MEVHPPVSPEFSILVTVNEDTSTYWQIDYRYFDQYSLEELSVDHIWNRIHEATAADKLLRMNYDIHTGPSWVFPARSWLFWPASYVPVCRLQALCSGGVEGKKKNGES